MKLLVTLIILVMAPVNLSWADKGEHHSTYPWSATHHTWHLLLESRDNNHKTQKLLQEIVALLKADSVRKEWEQLATFPFYAHRPDSVIDLPMPTPYQAIKFMGLTVPEIYAPLKTRLQITWLDSVAVVKCDWKYIWAIETMGVSTLPAPLFATVVGTTFVRPYQKYDDAFKTDSLWFCDTISWRMTELSLSEIKEGE